MHIVFLTHEYPKPGFPHGGVGTFIQTLGRWLVKNSHSVSILGVNYTSNYEEKLDQGVQIYRLPKQNRKGLTWWKHAQSIYQKLLELQHIHPIDVVEGTELSFAFLPRIEGVKYLIRMNGGHHFFAESENREINWWKGFQEKRSFKRADAVVGVSQYVVDHTSKYISFDSKKKGVIFNPANLEKFYPADPNKQVKGRILFAGTVCEKKGIRQLIQAMPIIKQAIPEAHLLVVGRDWKFPKTGHSYIEYLTDFIDSRIIDDIRFLGPVPNSEIPKLIEEAEICCYPSHMEAMPLAWIEVMAMGKAFVGSSLGPGKEIVQDGFNGLLCDPRQPTDIAEKVISMLRNNKEAMQMGERAREFALQNFSLDIIGKVNIKLYQSLL
jgi:glycosyltransferase involved in cell wall biosynthesis